MAAEVKLPTLTVEEHSIITMCLAKRLHDLRIEMHETTTYLDKLREDKVSLKEQQVMRSKLNILSGDALTVKNLIEKVE